MPIFYVNENLISEELQHTSTWQKTGEEYERWMIKTNGLERRTQDGSFERAERVICVHNLGKIPGDRTRVVATKFEGEEQYPAKVTVRTSSDTRYDTDVFIVAIPYDGIVLPTIDFYRRAVTWSSGRPSPTTPRSRASPILRSTTGRCALSVSGSV